MKFLPLLAVLPMLGAVAPPVLAQSGIAQCVALSQDSERLACYDAIFLTGNAVEAGLSVEVRSQQLIPARPAGRGPATITVRCEADVLSVAFAFAGNTMSALGNDAGLTLQNDLQQARSRTLPVNGDNTAVLLDNTGDAVAFLDGLVGANNLTARVTPVNSRSLSVRFSIDALLVEVAPVRAACNA